MRIQDLSANSVWWNDHQPRSPAPPIAAAADSSQPGVISIFDRAALRGKASRNGRMARKQTSSMAVSSQFRPLKIASTAANASTIKAAHQAAPRRERRPKASSSSTKPRIDEKKWLISISRSGAKARRSRKRVGSDGVAPEARSMTPADAVRIAAKVGAVARAAGLKTVDDIQIPERRIPDGIQQQPHIACKV